MEVGGIELSNAFNQILESALMLQSPSLLSQITGSLTSTISNSSQLQPKLKSQISKLVELAVSG
jgi:hypothetical protein